MSNLVHYVTYDAVGNIIQHGTCADTDLPLQPAPEGCTVMQGDGTFNKHYVLNGKIVAYTDAELLQKNNLDQGHIWQMPERVVVDTRALADAKAQAWERIKVSRALEEVKPFTCNGSLYDRDLERIAGAVQLALLSQVAGQAFSINWTLYDNTVKQLDGPGMIAVGVAMGQRTSSIFDTARDLRNAITAATTVSAADAIQWPS